MKTEDTEKQAEASETEVVETPVAQEATVDAKSFKTLPAARSAISQLVTRAETAEAELATAKAEIDTLKASVSAEQARAEQAEAELAGVQEEISKLTEEAKSSDEKAAGIVQELGVKPVEPETATEEATAEDLRKQYAEIKDPLEAAQFWKKHRNEM